MKILHTADIHWDSAHQEEALASMQVLLDTVIEERVGLVIIAGDLFGRGIVNSAASGFPSLIAVLRRILRICSIVVVRGTPTHDVRGCYDALTSLKGVFPFRLLQPDDEPFHIAGSDGEVYVQGMGEPSREWFLSGKQMGLEESTAAIKKGMRDILLGVGARWDRESTAPKIFVYHGEVEGSTLQNSQLLPAGGLALGRDDLALVGADYIALGHIHKWQQVPHLPAWFPGPAYNANWGETDKPGFNLVNFREHGAAVTRHDYPHPPRQVIITDHQLGYNKEFFEGYEVKLIVKGTREELRTIDRNQALEHLLECGAVEGSIVELEQLPTETVRAGGITELKGLRAKVLLWAGNSGLKLSAGVYGKAGQLEQEAEQAGRIHAGAHMLLDQVWLKGSIAIKRGLGLEQVKLDFRNRPPGLIGILGANGTGKTGFVENMQPFPRMLTRPGKLSDHFYHRDSWRDLAYTDEKTGDRWRFFIQIDGQSQAGRCEYHIYKNDGPPQIDGSKESYVEKVIELFGSLTLYLRSAFISQKPTKASPDLAAATEGEKKILFRELAGLDYLQMHSMTAKDRGGALEAKLTTIAAQVVAGRDLLTSLPLKREELEDRGEELGMGRDTLEAVDAHLVIEEQASAELEERVTAHNQVTADIERIAKNQDELYDQTTARHDKIAGHEAAREGEDDARETITKYNSLQTTATVLEGERDAYEAGRETALTERRDDETTAREAERTLSAGKAKAQKELGNMEADKAVRIVGIDNLNARLAEKLTCPKCNHVFSRDQASLEDMLVLSQQKILDIDVGINLKKQVVDAFIGEIGEILWPEEDPPAPYDMTELDSLRRSMDVLDVARARAVVEEAASSSALIAELREQMEQINVEMVVNTDKLAALETQMDAEAEGELLEHAQDLTATRERREKLLTEIAFAEGTIKALEADIALLCEQEELIEQREAELETGQVEQDEWELLQRACGPDGIQALELDAMAPSIADVTNQLLAVAYGSRYQVEFRTTRIAGKGSKTKQIEDFSIWVLDSKDGMEQPLETVSGGQEVWINRAIYDAFGIIRDRNTGQRFLTMFQDEADGKLDAEARIAYYRMLEAAHWVAERRHTLVITHSPEAQEMLSQKIRMEELK